MGQLGLFDPLGAVVVCAALKEELSQLGYTVQSSDDLHRFAELKLTVRQEKISPFFDPDMCTPDRERAFWTSISDGSGTCVGMQGFRYDFVDTSLADWGPSFIIGLYMRRQELLMPSHATPPRHSVAERLRGKLVYHGELWVDRGVKSRKVIELYSRLGLVLALIKWNPDAIWALASHQMATHGHSARMGFTYLERGFLRWQWNAEGIDPVEYLGVADRLSLEQMIEEYLTTGQLLPLAPPR